MFRKNKTKSLRRVSYEALLTAMGKPLNESPYALVVFLEICRLLKADWRDVNPDETLGKYIRFPAWLMTLDNLSSPVADLVYFLCSHESVSNSLKNLNDLRNWTFRETLALILQDERSPEKVNDRRFI